MSLSAQHTAACDAWAQERRDASEAVERWKRLCEQLREQVQTKKEVEDKLTGQLGPAPFSFPLLPSRLPCLQRRACVVSQLVLCVMCYVLCLMLCLMCYVCMFCVTCSVLRVPCYVLRVLSRVMCSVLCVVMFRVLCCVVLRCVVCCCVLWCCLVLVLCGV
jgi:hypothetical protein